MPAQDDTKLQHCLFFGYLEKAENRCYLSSDEFSDITSLLGIAPKWGASSPIEPRYREVEYSPYKSGIQGRVVVGYLYVKPKGASEGFAYLTRIFRFRNALFEDMTPEMYRDATALADALETTTRLIPRKKRRF